MQRIQRSAEIGLTLLTFLAAAGSPAGAVIDPDAERVVVQKASCAGIDNCFNDMATLTDWIWSVRLPDASAPLVVDVGPGSFDRFSCESADPDPGYVTLRGSGRDRTTIADPFFAVVTQGCDRLGFQDLRIQSDLIGVFWLGSGSSSWTNVDVVGTYTAWYDSACGGAAADPAAGIHYFFGSRLESQQLGFFAECGENWIYGSEILVRPLGPLTFQHTTGVWVSHRGDVRLFGSSVRIMPESPSVQNPPTVAVGVRVGPAGNMGIPAGSGEFHMHGGILSLKKRSGDLIGVLVDRANSGDALAHIVDTSWVLTAGVGGSATRVQELNGGHVHSPFTWPADSEPPRSIHGDPTSPLARSITGADMFVETDCAPNGDCDPPGNGDETHLMIYNEAKCGISNPWFDSTAGVCRQP